MIAFLFLAPLPALSMLGLSIDKAGIPSIDNVFWDQLTSLELSLHRTGPSPVEILSRYPRLENLRFQYDMSFNFNRSNVKDSNHHHVTSDLDSLNIVIYPKPRHRNAWAPFLDHTTLPRLKSLKVMSRMPLSPIEVPQ